MQRIVPPCFLSLHQGVLDVKQALDIGMNPPPKKTTAETPKFHGSSNYFSHFGVNNFLCFFQLSTWGAFSTADTKWKVRISSWWIPLSSGFHGFLEHHGFLNEKLTNIGDVHPFSTEP